MLGVMGVDVEIPSMELTRSGPVVFRQHFPLRGLALHVCAFPFRVEMFSFEHWKTDMFHLEVLDFDFVP